MEQVIDRIIEKFNVSKENKREEDIAFELLACSVAFKISPYRAIRGWNHIYKNGLRFNDGEDGKVDGYNIKVDNENNKIIIELMQAKNKNKVRTTEIESFFYSVNNYVIQRKPLAKNYFSLEKLIKEIDEYTDKHPTYTLEYNLYIVFRGEPDRIDDINKNTLDKFDSVFDHSSENLNYIVCGEQDIENYIKNSKEKILNRNFNDNEIAILFKDNVSSVSNVDSEYDVYIAAIEAKEIFKIIENEFEENFDLSRLFNGNVRGFLSTSKINDQIKNTIIHNPSDLLALNNGAVIYCSDIKYLNSQRYLLKNPVIINGQQTIASIYNSIEKNDINQPLIQVKFLSPKDSCNKNLQMMDIAKSSNTMNQIEPLDLVTNTPLMDNIRKVFFENDVYISAKNGEILNEIFISQIVDIVEIFQYFSSVFGKRPDYSKTRKKLITIFHDIYYKKDSKESVMIEKENEIAEAMYRSYEIKNIMNKFYDSNKERVTLYYEHAKFFILYVISDLYGHNFIYENIDSDLVLDKIEALIEVERTNKISKNLEFTYNNYFKSMKPTKDYHEQNSEREYKPDFVNNVMLI